jgi:hypothetical protein
MRQDFRQTIYKLKVTIMAIVSFVVGFGLLVLAGYAEGHPELAWVTFWQINSIGGTLFAAGLFGIVWDYFDGKDKEARDTERLKRVLADSSTELKAAVIEGFAVGKADLARVATPELLDSIATNALALRLSDEEFASEIYKDLRDNAIRAPERWHDCDVKIRLSSINENAGGGNAPSASLPLTPAFAVTVTWEYTVMPSYSVHKFACTSDRAEFHELISESPATSTWFMTPRPGFHASERRAYELLQFSVDGEDRPIRRSERKSGQTYSVVIGDDVVAEGKPVRIRHVYRTMVAKELHRMSAVIAQPTKGLSLTMDYTDTDIAAMSVTDLISSSQRPRVDRLPAETAAHEIDLSVSGWLLPQAEVTFVWTLASEASPSSDERTVRAA